MPHSQISKLVSSRRSRQRADLEEAAHQLGAIVDTLDAGELPRDMHRTMNEIYAHEATIRRVIDQATSELLID